jgi:polyisoprenoid-binding protein YceI
MNRKLIAFAILISLAAPAYVALHPGVAYVEPAIAAAPSIPLGRATYTIDPMHAAIYFEITHLGLSQVHGRINEFSGKIVEDGDNLANSSVEFSANIASIDTGVPARDEHLQAADFFDAAQYPTLSFRSTGVECCGDGYVVHGNLTIKGVTRSIDIPFTHHGPYTMQGMGEQPTRIGVVAEPVVIRRTDFGVGTNDPLPDGTIGASDEVVVRISFEAMLDAAVQPQG